MFKRFSFIINKFTFKFKENRLHNDHFGVSVKQQRYLVVSSYYKVTVNDRMNIVVSSSQSIYIPLMLPKNCNCYIPIIFAQNPVYNLTSMK